MADRFSYRLLCKIFQYLNGRDLYYSSLVCSLWFKASLDVNFSRGLSFVYYPDESNNDIHGDSFALSLRKCPTIFMKFHMTIVFNKISVYFNEDCLCRYMPPVTYKLLLYISYEVDDFSPFIVSLSFPYSFNLTIDTYSFHKIHQTEVYVPEMRIFLPNNFFFDSSFISWFLPYFINENPMKTVMILLCELENIQLLQNIVISLEYWFPFSNIPIWGGITKKMKSCGTFNDDRKCKVSLGCIFYFIRSEELKVWNIDWYSYHENKARVNEKLEHFKQQLVLKKNSLGFIYVPGFRNPSSYKTEYDLLQKYFPSIPFVFLNGPGAFGGTGLRAPLLKMAVVTSLHETRRFISDTQTLLMIITYD